MLKPPALVRSQHSFGKTLPPPGLTCQSTNIRVLLRRYSTSFYLATVTTDQQPDSAVAVFSCLLLGWRRGSQSGSWPPIRPKPISLFIPRGFHCVGILASRQLCLEITLPFNHPRSRSVGKASSRFRMRRVRGEAAHFHNERLGGNGRLGRRRCWPGRA